MENYPTLKVSRDKRLGLTINYHYFKTFNIGETKYILYIPSLFIYDHYFDGKLIDAHNTYDWLLKLSYFLKKNNLIFKVKLHPEKKIPDEFFKYYKKNISEKNLAKSIKDSYLIITDQPSSSSFAASIVSEKPIIFIDLKFMIFLIMHGNY